MAGRIVRLVCIVLMSFWLTGKIVVFSPLLAIPLIGATVLFMINEIREIKEAKHAKTKSKKRPSGNKKITKKSN